MPKVKDLQRNLVNGSNISIYPHVRTVMTDNKKMVYESCVEAHTVFCTHQAVGRTHIIHLECVCLRRGKSKSHIINNAKSEKVGARFIRIDLQSFQPQQPLILS